MSEASNRVPAGEDFAKVETPIINKCYHLSWAYRGAIFHLLSIDGDKGTVKAPKNANKKPLTINLRDLRETKS